ncbi:MAG: imidazole glycerol phosphate synthase subunit HisH [Candidatus Nitrotoga sp.]
MADIAVIDYGMGNLRSVQQSLRKVAPTASIILTSDPREVARAGRVVFPGQGAMPDCMREMDERGLRGVVLDAAKNKPFLGICIGLQMLFEHSTEGNITGLGILRGQVVRFASHLLDQQGNKLKIPHMGWNQVHRVAQHPLWQGVAQDARFYFVHSYYVVPQEAAIVQANTDYPTPFVCAVARDNLLAVQFHPEKSQDAGLTLLKNFVAWKP